MRILFIHEVNYRKKVVYEIHDFPELLSLRGHEVAFIDFPEGERRGGVRRILDLRMEFNEDQARAHEGASVHLRTPGRVLPPPFDRLVASVTQVPAIHRALRDGEFDAVVLYGVPTNGWQTIRLARRHAVPVLFRAIDISHELRPTVYKTLIRRAERYIFRHADAVSANNVALRDYAIAAGAPPDKVSVEYPGVDLDRFRPGAKPAHLLERYGVRPEDVVVLFMGTFFPFAGLDWFLEQFEPVLSRISNVKVLLIGGGGTEKELRQRVMALGLEGRVIFTGFIEYEELKDHLLLGDVAINPFDEQLVTKCALPGKILQYAGCGLPTVCTRLDGMRAMVPEGEGITYRAPGTEFLAAVQEWLRDPVLRGTASARARAAVEARCQWNACAEAFEFAIERVVARAGTRP